MGDEPWQNRVIESNKLDWGKNTRGLSASQIDQTNARLQRICLPFLKE